jgi:hypothetical protein
MMATADIENWGRLDKTGSQKKTSAPTAGCAEDPLARPSFMLQHNAGYSMMRY